MKYEILEKKGMMISVIDSREDADTAWDAAIHYSHSKYDSIEVGSTNIRCYDGDVLVARVWVWNNPDL